VSKQLERALEAARKAQGKAALLQLVEVTTQNARDLQQLIRMRDFAAARDRCQAIRGALEALVEVQGAPARPAQEENPTE